MIRTVGIVGLSVASVVVGYSLASHVKGRVDELVYVKRLMTMFQGELRYKNVMLSEAFSTISMKARGVYKELFQGLAIATEENHSLSMAEVFSDKVDQILIGRTLLNKEDISRLKELGETMGYQDQKMQLANIELYIDRLSESIEEDRTKMKDIMKMYRTLGVMGALMCLIIFI